MKQSLFTQISKVTDRRGELISLPSKEEAECLFKAVAEDKCEDAFRRIFQLYRFGKMPESYAEEEISNLIAEAFRQGAKNFR